MKKVRPGVQTADLDWQYWRQQLDTRMSSLRSTRLSWWAHWAQMAENYLPRRYKWFVTPNQSNRGSQMNQGIIDETGLLCARNLASGMFTGMTRPTSPWFKLGFRNKAILQYGEVRNWLEIVETKLYDVLAGSNFYQSRGVYYRDLAVFCSAMQICYEDAKQVVRFVNPCLGEFFFWVDNRNVVEGAAREYTYTVQQTVNEFGIENVSPSVRAAYHTGGAGLDREVVICHVMEPNEECFQMDGKSMGYPVAKRFAYREVFWEQGSTVSLVLRAAGFNEKPFIGGRWDVTSNDPYGHGPGMDGLPAVRQLQIEQTRKAEAIAKMVRPPMVGSIQMKNEPNSIAPGAMNYVADMSQAGFKPAFLVDPRLAEMLEDIKELQDRIGKIFFNDLFLMISNLDTVRTATEIDARREEKLVMLGPVIERDQNESLDPTLERVFSICLRRGLFPPPPQQIRGEELEIEYISMLAQAQRAASTSSIERLLGLAGNLEGVYPGVMDNIDIDKTIEQYADDLQVPPHLIRSLAGLKAIRDQRAQQQKIQQQTEATPAMAQAAKTLSDTQTGAGKTALQQMLGN